MLSILQPAANESPVYQLGGTFIASGGAGAAFVGPLDDYTADLSLALLPFRGFSAYTGTCWRVRDDGDGGAEQEVGFDSTGEPIFPALIGNGGVRFWRDQSGLANDLPQATAASQPYLTNSVLNGYPVSRFDGVNDFMDAACVNSADRTIYMVARMRTSITNARLSNDSLNNNASLYDTGSASYGYYLTNPNVVDPVGGVSTAWNIITLRYSGGNTLAPWVSNVAATPFGTTAFLLGAHYWLAADTGGLASFAELDLAARLQYDAAHDTTTRQAIQTILAGRFGITL